MKIFISWSGDYSQRFAEAIHWWLRKTLQFTRPFFTPIDIDKGKRWNDEISKELEHSQIGIIAMTQENLTSPWIMFEAGAISKVVGQARVCPIVFGIGKTDLKGPLAGFQATAFNEKEVRQLLETINAAASKEVALTERDLDEAFNMWWPQLEQKIQAISSTAQPSSTPQRDERELLEEIVENTRSIIREFQLYQSRPHIIKSPTVGHFEPAPPTGGVLGD